MNQLYKPGPKTTIGRTILLIKFQDILKHRFHRSQYNMTVPTKILFTRLSPLMTVLPVLGKMMTLMTLMTVLSVLGKVMHL